MFPVKLTSVRRKVFFKLSDTDWHGFASESVWTVASRFRQAAKVQNSPFFVKGISYNDVIQTERRKGVLWFSGVQEKSGDSTLRLRTRDFLTRKGAVVDGLERLINVGCSCEWVNMGDARLFALNIPRAVDAHEIVRVVDDGASRDLWDAEMGDTGGRVGFWHY